MLSQPLPSHFEILSFSGHLEVGTLGLSLILVLILFFKLFELGLQSIILVCLVLISLDLLFVIKVDKVHTRTCSHSSFSGIGLLRGVG